MRGLELRTQQAHFSVQSVVRGPRLRSLCSSPCNREDLGLPRGPRRLQRLTRLRLCPLRRNGHTRGAQKRKEGYERQSNGRTRRRGA